MYNKVRNIELPENLFSNLGEIKSKQLEEKNNARNHENNEIKLTNYSKKDEYRNRISKMYKDMSNICPIDSEIENTIYLNNYHEKGIVIKPKISSLKQFWTEYRLMNNEKILKEDKKRVEVEVTLSDFDSLFDALSLRVSEINKYIDELKEMRINIEESSKQLDLEKNKFFEEKEKFLNFKEKEENKLKVEKDNLKINFNRLQTIIDDLDKKLEDINR